MKRMVLAMGALSILAAGGMGCRTVDEKRADYHEWRAQRAADKGNYDSARKQREKADRARENLPTDKLP
jgi:hypothetical protein